MERDCPAYNWQWLWFDDVLAVDPRLPNVRIARPSPEYSPMNTAYDPSATVTLNEETVELHPVRLEDERVCRVGIDSDGRLYVSSVGETPATPPIRIAQQCGLMLAMHMVDRGEASP